MTLTPHQRKILALARSNGGTVTKKQVVENFGHRYFCNAEKHVGDCLSRMIKARLLDRLKPGVYAIGAGTKAKPAAAVIIENQKTLF